MPKELILLIIALERPFFVVGSAFPQGTLQESGQFWLKYCKAEGELSSNSQQEEEEKCPHQSAASGGLILQSHMCSECKIILNNTKSAIIENSKNRK